MTEITKDPTYDKHSAFASMSWLASRLGRSKDWFSRNKDQLHHAGLPEPDPVVGLYSKADVDAWITRRRKVADFTKDVTVNVSESSKPEVNHDGL